MDPHGHIYELTEEEIVAANGQPFTGEPIDPSKLSEIREDMARLDGYLKGRADSDRPKRGKGANKDLAG